MYDCREGRGVIIGNTQSVSISFLFLFFFHQSSLYPIKIFAKCFYLLVKKEVDESKLQRFFKAFFQRVEILRLLIRETCRHADNKFKHHLLVRPRNTELNFVKGIFKSQHHCVTLPVSVSQCVFASRQAQREQKINHLTDTPFS